MKRFNNPVELILEREPSQKGMDNLEKLLAAEGIAIEPLTESFSFKINGVWQVKETQGESFAENNGERFGNKSMGCSAP